MPRPFGFNVIGHVSGNLGAGVSARNTIQALIDNGFRVSVLDVDPGLDRGNRDLSYESIAVPAPEDLPYAVNVLIFGLSTFMGLVGQYRSLLADPSRFNVAFVWWELPVVPFHCRPALEFFDALVAPSAFIRHTLEFALSHAPVIGARQPLRLPANVTADRRRFNIDPEAIVYTTSLEFAGYAKRKNVLGIIEAFQKGTTENAGARLIIRINNAANVSTGDAAFRALRDASNRDLRIRLLTEPLDYHDVMRLYASSDVFVSLHRSEGLGLAPMEAMALGKPCVATAWSGNMDYMNHTNTALVPYTLVPVIEGPGPYSARALHGTRAQWANPDIDEAAAWIARLAEDRELRIGLGNRASEAIASFQKDAARTRFGLELRALWQHHALVGRSTTRTDRLNAAFAARVANQPGSMRAIAKARRAAAQALDRHVLWRFRH